MRPAISASQTPFGFAKDFLFILIFEMNQPHGRAIAESVDHAGNQVRQSSSEDAGERWRRSEVWRPDGIPGRGPDAESGEVNCLRHCATASRAAEEKKSSSSISFGRPLSREKERDSGLADFADNCLVSSTATRHSRLSSMIWRRDFLQAARSSRANSRSRADAASRA